MELKRAAIGTTEREENKAPYSVVQQQSREVKKVEKLQKRRQGAVSRGQRKSHRVQGL